MSLIPHPLLLLLHVGVIRSANYLAAKRAETEGVEEAPLTNLAGVCDALSWPWLWALVEEDDAGAVDDVGLNTADVENLLYLRNSHNIVV